MQRTLQPYSMLPTDPKNTNAMFSDLAGTSTLDPLAQVPLPTPMGAQTTGAIAQNEIDASTGKVISNTLLNNTPQDQIIS